MASNTHVAQGSSPLTVEERLNQLQHSLSLLISERESLTASLKTARRDAQKADAAVRSEIDVLKRASEKHVAAELRARQKVLALQEAVKRAQSATREMENSVKVIEKSLPGLKARRAEKEEEYTKVKEDADRGRKEMEKEAEKDRKKVETMKGELSTLGNKMEKLTGKREKLETVVIPDLEEQLREIEREIEKAEKAESEPHVVYEFPTSSDDGFYDEGDHNGGTDRQSYLPVQRARHSSATSSHPSTAGAIGRPPPPPPGLVTPIQRPSYTPLWAPAPAPTRNRTQSSQLSPVTSMRNATHPSGTSNSNSNSNSTSSSSSPTPAAAQSSTLSSRAPAFEPSRIPLALRSSPSHSSALANSSGSGSSSGMGSAPGSGYTPSPPITIQRQPHHTNPSPSHYGNIWGFEGRANGAG